MKRMNDGSPESELAEVDAALERIRLALDETYRRDGLKAKRSAVRLLVMTVLASMFLKGMPLHFLFYPFGQMGLVVWVLICGWAGIDFTIFIWGWFERRSRAAIGRVAA